jgi:uncharacterized protein YbaP (TraB family)
MHRQIIVMFFGLFCLLGGPAPAAPATTAAPLAAASTQARGALFKVQGAGHTLYLFGTMHVGLPEFYPLEPRITAAVSQASVLALEIDPGRDPALMAQDMARYGTFAAGSDAYARLDPAKRARLDKVLGSRHLALQSVAHLKPWLLATVLALGEFTELGYRADLAVDAHLATLARQHQVPLLELESVGAQLALFSRLTEAQQWRFLEETVEAIETGKQGAQVRDIVDAWRNADQRGLDAMAVAAEADTSTSGAFIEQVLLEERNTELADKLAQLLGREPSAVAAVGVLHLVGKRSIPLLLRARGLTVERVY